MSNTPRRHSIRWATGAAGVLAAALMLQVAAPAAAQTKTIPGQTVTTSATVEAIDTARRTLSLKDEKGIYHDVKVPESVRRFSEIKVGDKITATYYDNIIVRVKAAGEKDVNTGTTGVVPSGGARPGATASTQRTITATIVAIDSKIPSISFKGPNGWAYSSRVEDTEALKKVKVGDKVDITWTEALLVSLEAPK